MRKIELTISFDSLRLGIFKKILDLYPYHKKLVDLGAGSCEFSKAAVEKGFNVVAVDARSKRIPENIKKFGIKFIKVDINNKDFKPVGYDLICILGLLYHLTLDEQIALLKKCSYATTIIDTHYTNDFEILNKNYKGKYYIEGEEIRKDARSAYTSSHSFWHTEESLIKLIHDCGYEVVVKVVPEVSKERYFYICEPKLEGWMKVENKVKRIFNGIIS